jgi:hypothetical protein
MPAVCRSSRAAATIQAAGDRGYPGEVLDVVGEQRLPWPIKSMAMQTRRRAESWPIVLDAGRQASF